MTLREQLVHDEDLRLFPYTDTVGKLTIGVGRNLTDRGLSRAEALMLLDNDIALCRTQLTTHLPWVAQLDPARQDVLLNMCFNLGIAGLLQFTTTLAHIQHGRYTDAAASMLQSKWARQVGARAQRLATVMAS